MLDLPAMFEALLEQAELVADAIAVAGQAQRRHAVQEAGGQTAQAAVAQRRVRLHVDDVVQSQAQSVQRVADRLHHAQIGEAVGHQAADQELQRQVVNPLGVGLVIVPRGLHPAIDKPIPDAVSRCGEPVATGGGSRVLTHRVNQTFQKGPFEGFRVQAPVFQASRIIACVHGYETFCCRLHDSNRAPLFAARMTTRVPVFWLTLPERC